FRAMDVKVQRGRPFNDADGVAGQPVAIVDQRLAEKFWPAQDPIGKRLRIFDRNKPQAWMTVLGVVPNILQNIPNQNNTRELTALIYVTVPAKADARHEQLASKSVWHFVRHLRTDRATACLGRAVRDGGSFG